MAIRLCIMPHKTSFPSDRDVSSERCACIANSQRDWMIAVFEIERNSKSGLIGTGGARRQADVEHAFRRQGAIADLDRSRASQGSHRIGYGTRNRERLRCPKPVPKALITSPGLTPTDSKAASLAVRIGFLPSSPRVR